MRRLSSEHGNVVIIVALMMTALLGAAALSIDAGMMYVRHSQVQTGADAAALAIARECAERAVDNNAAGCNSGMASDLAGDYLGDNVGDTAQTPSFDLRSEHDGRAGRITVTGSTDESSAFASMLGVEQLRTAATATARWGPLTAVDTVFPLAVCKGVLPEPGDDVTLMSVPSGEEPSQDPCDGAPTEQPFGFFTPTDPEQCESKVALLPSTWLDVSPSDDPPTSPGCGAAISELLNDLVLGRWPHWTQQRGWHWHDWTAPSEQRTRVLAVYDASRSSGATHPAYALIGFEFTGARLGDREEHGDDPWDGVCDPDDDALDIEERQCIRGEVTNYLPPEDGPIVDLSQLVDGGIPDTTVLDVRLVD